MGPVSQVRQVVGDLRRLEEQGGAERAPTPGWGEVAALCTHWDRLDDGRKIRYAQMAALTRSPHK